MAANEVRVGVIGLGNMGSCHVRDIGNEAIPGLKLAAVCDILQERADQWAEQFKVPAYYDYRSLLRKAELDAIIVATPHYDHTPISIAGLKAGLHVLTEKPLAVHVKDGRKMIAAYEEVLKTDPNRVFAIMFQQRTYGFWRKIKEMIDRGDLGKLVRATWIITDWFRTQVYYDNGGWRATWKGEGGGVLLNQCPHNLDLYQWFFGLPKRVGGFISIGKYHNIEVEDEVTAYFEHENGMVGHFITTTAESPGTNRLEVVGENGKLVFEAGKLTFTRNAASMFEVIRTSELAFTQVENTKEEIPYPAHIDPGHTVVLEAFAQAVLAGAPLVARAPEGLNGLSIGNAIMHSAFLGHPVDLPLDENAYAAKLKRLIKASDFKKAERNLGPVDLADSYSTAKR
jgi:predicted dehydrogenase